MSLSFATVWPSQYFSAVADAEALREAMEGLGTNENVLISIICQRANKQRQLIRETYKTNFGRNLIDDIRSDTSGNFRKVLIAAMTPIVDFCAKELFYGMEGIGTDEEVLIEILCSMNNHEIELTKNAYEKRFKRTLESDIVSDTSGDFRRILVSLCNGKRDESNTVCYNAAGRDATMLLNAGEKRLGTNENKFITVFCQRSYDQIEMINTRYKELTGHGLDVAIRKEKSGYFEEALLAIWKCSINKSEYFASRLHKSMKGLGTNDNQLIRSIVWRSEIDLGNIKDAFKRLYGNTLSNWVKDDTSGDYLKALLALIGVEN